MSQGGIMKKCIYCNTEKSDDEFSLEHAIPRFLGGADAPERFKLHNVCQRCNNNLGLFVDAAFAKTFWIANWLQQSALEGHDPQARNGVPLFCMGQSKLEPPGMTEEELCECWLGPFGEQVYWIRPKDDRLYWYVGGNPITAKVRETRAYFLLSERTSEYPEKTLRAFRDAFSDAMTVKIMCTEIFGFDVAQIGFSEPDRIDRERIQYFLAECAESTTRSNAIPYNLHYDFRFMSKLALGLSFSVFGEAFLQSAYCDELRRGVWFREGEPEPQIRGMSAHQRAAMPGVGPLLKFTGQANAVTITLNMLREGAMLTLNIGERFIWSVLCATFDVASQSYVEGVESGFVLVLYPHQRKAIELSLPDFLAHKLGHRPDARLVHAERDATRHQGTFT